ncbi:28866_t:CDS:2, partial [Racocetra persica]
SVTPKDRMYVFLRKMITSSSVILPEDCGVAAAFCSCWSLILKVDVLNSG